MSCNLSAVSATDLKAAVTQLKTEIANNHWCPEIWGLAILQGLVCCHSGDVQACCRRRINSQAGKGAKGSLGIQQSCIHLGHPLRIRSLSWVRSEKVDGSVVCLKSDTYSFCKLLHSETVWSKAQLGLMNWRHVRKGKADKLACSMFWRDTSYKLICSRGVAQVRFLRWKICSWRGPHMSRLRSLTSSPNGNISSVTVSGGLIQIRRWVSCV